MMEKKPERENYQEWQNREFVLDSIAWEQDPLYGWCNKNLKRNGEPYNVNTDGLRIYTTIDTRMQQYAEKAVRRHVGGYLQAQFNIANRYKKNAPFSSHLSHNTIKAILNRSCKLSTRYLKLKEQGATPEEIKRSFRTPHEMTLFTYHGDIDTVMTPIDSIRYYKSFLRSAFMSMEVRTGAVKAYVGGIDYEHFKYDMGMGGRRQVGSTIKPYLYALAMQNGMTPCSTAPNVQRTYGGWTPRNGSRARYGQQVPLRWGLQQSNNWISAYLISLLGPQQFVGILHDFGLNNPDIEKNVGPVLCLGPCEVSVGEMTSAYTTFANHGIRCAPLFVTKIEDSHGNVIAKFQPLMNEVISEESAYKMIDMLRAVVNGGTASRLRGYGLRGDICGKTGTTTNHSDGWFMALRRSLSTAVGWAAKTATSISIPCRSVRALPWHCPSGPITWNRSMPTSVWVIVPMRVSTFPRASTPATLPIPFPSTEYRKYISKGSCCACRCSAAWSFRRVFHLQRQGCPHRWSSSERIPNKIPKTLISQN